MADFQKRVAIVTGGAGGMGSCITRRLAESGHAVAIIGRNAEKGKAFEKELRANGLDVTFFRHDVTDASRRNDLMDAVHSEWNRPVSILVSTAGQLITKRILEITEEDFERGVNLNLKGDLLMCQAVLPEMQEQGFGRIVNITSVLEDYVFEARGMYGAAKAGLNYLTKVIALEFGKYGITANTVAPGVTLSPMSAEAIKDPVKWNKWMDRTARGKFAEPEDIAELVCFLVSDQAAHINGQSVHIDGGLF